jgi:hypothetical protein
MVMVWIPALLDGVVDGFTHHRPFLWVDADFTMAISRLTDLDVLTAAFIDDLDVGAFHGKHVVVGR